MFKAEIIDNTITITHCGEIYMQNPEWNYLREAGEKAEDLNLENGYEEDVI